MRAGGQLVACRGKPDLKAFMMPATDDVLSAGRQCRRQNPPPHPTPPPGTQNNRTDTRTHNPLPPPCATQEDWARAAELWELLWEAGDVQMASLI